MFRRQNMLRREIAAWLVCSTFAGVAGAASLLEQKIDEARRTARAIQGGVVGVEVVQLATGKVLYASNEDHLFTPASNTKLFSTALALTRLGPKHRMTTRVMAVAAPDAKGRLEGDLTIVGGADPSMSFIGIPYAAGAKPVDPLTGVEALADQVTAAGVRSIAGGVVGDDTAYPVDFYPPGWAADDAIWDYGAPVSALTLADNSMRMDIGPGAGDDDPVTVTFTPAIGYFLVSNRVRVTAEGPHHLEVRRSGRQLELSGTIGRAGVTEWLAVDDPALFFAAAFHDALTRRGVSIGRGPSAAHRYEGAVAPATGVTLAERRSPELAELLNVTGNVIPDWRAEVGLCGAGRARGGDGSRLRGLEEMQAFLAEAGISEKDYVLVDGSGLSRLTLLSPDAIVTLLRYMKRSTEAEAWTALLPVGGQDGTLEKRFHKDAAARNIHAKTGSLSHVNALSGYADSATYGELAFSIVVNHTAAPASEVREFIDRIGMILLE